MKTRIAYIIAIGLICYSLTSCANNPEGNALAREAMLVALSEYQRQHPICDDK